MGFTESKRLAESVGKPLGKMGPLRWATWREGRAEGEKEIAGAKGGMDLGCQGRWGTSLDRGALFARGGGPGGGLLYNHSGHYSSHQLHAAA